MRVHRLRPNLTLDMALCSSLVPLVAILRFKLIIFVFWVLLRLMFYRFNTGQIFAVLTMIITIQVIFQLQCILPSQVKLSFLRGAIPSFEKIKISLLDLTDNLLSDWGDVAEILASFKNLVFLTSFGYIGHIKLTFRDYCYISFFVFKGSKKRWK